MKEGKLILFELAPIDPRSLMQGDYMRLNYKIAETTGDEIRPKKGYCVVITDNLGVAKKVRFQKDKKPLNRNENMIEYTKIDDFNTKIGAESFFFQEGNAKKYENAKYGGLKIDDNGNSLLIGLYDENRIIIN